MTSTSRRTLAVSIVAAGALGAAVLGAAPAMAYPPGGLNLGASSLTVDENVTVTLTATGATKGCVVYFSSRRGVQLRAKAVKANAGGTAVTSARMREAGSYTVNASTKSGKCGGQSASVTITVNDSDNDCDLGCAPARVGAAKPAAKVTSPLQLRARHFWTL